MDNPAPNSDKESQDSAASSAEHPNNAASEANAHLDATVSDSVPNPRAGYPLHPLLIPYLTLMRLDRSTGFLLLWLPCLWGMALAPSFLTQEYGLILVLGMSMLFFIGAVVMRGAGCVLNDILDRNIDRQVERTKNRPLASGQASVPGALILLLVLLCCGAAILYAFSWTTFYLGLAVLPLIALYPLMKRIMGMPQLILGFAFNWGVLLGWSAVGEDLLHPSLLLLYAAGVLWTIGYDTIYATQDIEDDDRIGAGSFALTIHRISPTWLIPSVGMIYVCSWACMCGAIYFSGLNPWAMTTLLPVLAHFAWQIMAWDSDDPKSALRIFQSNTHCGALVAAALVVANIGGKF